MEWPASAKRGGASARIRRAIAPILSSRMWLATVTGPNRHKAGTTGLKIRGEQTTPGTSKIGIVLSMPGSGSGGFHGKTSGILEPEIKTPASPVKSAGEACESE